MAGFVVDARLDGEDRIVTFFNSAVLREILIDLDEEARRLVWSVVDGPYTHHNSRRRRSSPRGRAGAASSGPPTSCRAAGPVTGEMMEKGIGVVKETLEKASG